MLVAPSGYGKSTTLLQWLDTYFSGSDPLFKNDIVCLIDGGIFFTIYSKNHNVKLLNQVLDFDIKESFGTFFGSNPLERKGRIVIIIDDIDEIFSTKEKYLQVVENMMRIIMTNQGNSWFKVILTCRPENLEIFSSLINRNLQLREYWYNVNFFSHNHSEAINVPHFNLEEIQSVLSNYGYHLPVHYFSLYKYELVNIVCNPWFLSIFIRANNIKNEFSEIIFLNNLVQRTIYAPPFSEEKQHLIHKFFELCDNGQKISFVNKETLIQDADSLLAYRELRKSGIIYESLVTEGYIDIHCQVRFANFIVFKYLLVRNLLKNKTLNISLFQSVFEKYKNNTQLRCAIISWVVKIAFFERDIDLIKQIHRFMEQRVEIPVASYPFALPACCQSLSEAVCQGLRNEPEYREILLPWLAQSRFGQILYFEESFDMDNLMFYPAASLDVYLQNNNTANGQAFIHFIRFIKGFFSLDSKLCTFEYENIRKINPAEINNPLFAGFYQTVLILYQNYYLNKKDPEIINKIILISAEIRRKGIQTVHSIPHFEFCIIYNLNLCNLFPEILSLLEYIEKYYDFSHIESTGFYQFYKLCHARALLNTGNEVKALELYRQITVNPFPFNLRHFMQLNTDLVELGFLYYQHKNREALKLINEIKSLAGYINYNFFIQKAVEFETKFKG